MYVNAEVFCFIFLRKAKAGLFQNVKTKRMI